MQVSSVSTYISLPLEASKHKENTDKLQNTTQAPKEELKQDEENKTSDQAVKSDSELTNSERQQVTELRQIDSQVRAHEAAHIAAGGSAISGGASFTYQKGPDGQLYAVAGEVPISSAGASTPEAKIAIARDMQAGALAPANPSPQDLKVAASAAQMEAQARQELNAEKSEEQKEKEVDTYAKNQDETTQSEEPSILSISA